MPSHPRFENPIVNMTKIASDGPVPEDGLAAAELQQMIEKWSQVDLECITDSMMDMMFGEGADMARQMRSLDFDTHTINLGAEEGESTLTLEVARTPAQRERGLMGRDEVPRGHGMAFIFDADDKHPFWMRNTSVPLDAAFVSGEGKVREIKQLEPHDETSVEGKGQVVIEVPRGWLEEQGIDEGDELPIGGLMENSKSKSKAKLASSKSGSEIGISSALDEDAELGELGKDEDDEMETEPAQDGWAARMLNQYTEGTSVDTP